MYRISTVSTVIDSEENSCAVPRVSCTEPRMTDALMGSISRWYRDRTVRRFSASLLYRTPTPSRAEAPIVVTVVAVAVTVWVPVCWMAVCPANAPADDGATHCKKKSSCCAAKISAMSASSSGTEAGILPAVCCDATRMARCCGYLCQDTKVTADVCDKQWPGPDFLSA